MKILIITNHSYMLYRFRLELIKRLMREHEVIISTPFVGHEDDLQALGLRCIETQVDRRGIDPRTDLKLFRTYQKLLKREKPDLVLTYSIKPNIYAGLACSLAGISYCANVQGLGSAFQRPGLAKLVTIMYKAAMGRARTVFFENEGNAREFLDRGIIKEKTVTVLPGAGVDIAEYAPLPYPDNEPIRFLYLGRIMREKGMDELFSAFRRLHAELGGRARLDLVGFFDDDYEQTVKQLCDEGLAVFHGFQTDPRPYYAAADCVVLASYHEGMSNVLLEAAACARPLITSDIFGCREAVEKGVSGFLCRAQDADSLYEQMRRFAELSAEQRREMGLAGRRLMEERFDKAAVVEQTIRAML